MKGKSAAWEAVDRQSGLRLVGPFGTKKECMAALDPAVMVRYAKYRENSAWRAAVRMSELVYARGSMPTSEYNQLKERYKAEELDKFEQSRKEQQMEQSAEKKPTGYIVTGEDAEGTAYIHRVACKKEHTATMRLARVADAEFPENGICAEPYSGTAEGDGLFDRLKDELKADHDRVITLVGTPGSCLRTIWEREKLTPPPAEKPENAPKPEPKAAKPKAPKPPAPPEQSAPVVEAAIVVSSETMTKWCEERGLTFNQKREGCPMWVHGASKPYKDELLEMGFRWGCSKTWGKGWYRRVA